ncbi:SLBB domain-containing protein, partial [uncultured Phenylobacterium sp.]|uniref:SLBB domain-containing protein n=1 Tax=uncultured Phenylobacterium sp. TaxID=349273 RepID=UPI0025ED672A
VLGPEDVIEYDVVGTNDRTRARIYADGTFQTSFGTRLTAAGRTPRDLSAVISKALRDGGYYADPVVNVEVVGYASRYVTILGAVGAPGLVPINRRYRLSEILARVGGVRGDAADYVIVRSEAGPERRYVVDRIISGEAEQDPYVEAGDRIFAPPADLFYLSGQIRSPGSYPLKTGMTVAQAIAKGGGVTESGSDKKVKVRRGDKKITLRPDDKVEPGDVLTISERLF